MAMAFSRRSALKAAGVATAASAIGGRAFADEPAKGNIKQSICRWCYNGTNLKDIKKLVEAALKLGYKSIELLSQPEFLQIKDSGLTCAMLNGARSIENCLNRVDQHDRVERELKSAIEFAAANGIRSVICFSGNRKGMSDDEGLENCATGLKRVMKLAEEKNINVCMELLNSKVNHKDYMCDRTPWGVALCKKVGSPRFKLLYDIYHMQIMEGDVIRTIKENKEFIAHYHTGGNPGRNEIDETQELFYPAIMKAILETGYDGFVGQEFIPKRDAFQSLAQAFKICDV
jgi:hydroxypyruvate isomerase